MNDNLWYTYIATDVLEKLGTDAQTGLNNDEAARRLEKYGKNMLKQKKTTSPLILFLMQFNQPLVYILVIASIITALLRR
jgi:Ca2+-transporting ATPase